MNAPEASDDGRQSLSAEEAIRQIQVKRETITQHELEAINAAFAALNRLTTRGQIRALDFLQSALRDPNRPEEVPF